MAPRVLVAGLGNIFLGDDAFGVEVVKRLAGEGPPEGVDVVDFGIRGVHLAYELSSSRYDSVILVDAVPRGGAPGTVYVIEPEAAIADDAAAEAASADAHSLTPAAVLAWVARIGGNTSGITIVGCEPASIDESMEMSSAVSAAVDEAVRTIRERLSAKEREAAPCA